MILHRFDPLHKILPKKHNEKNQAHAAAWYRQEKGSLYFCSRGHTPISFLMRELPINPLFQLRDLSTPPASQHQKHSSD